MEVNIERYNIIENNRKNISANATMNGELLEEVSNFNTGAILSIDGMCKTEIYIIITTPTSVMAKLSRVLIKEQHRLPNQAQTIQIYGAPPCYMGARPIDGKYMGSNSRHLDEIHEEAVMPLLLGTQDK